MPYISNEKNRRKDMDKIVKLMGELNVKANGDLNYILYAFCKRYTIPSYNNYKNFIGELDCCAREIYRRLIAEYEDEKIYTNGDVD